jgi:hypothetical protein
LLIEVHARDDAERAVYLASTANGFPEQREAIKSWFESFALGDRSSVL